jgi:hypothetical protein
VTRETESGHSDGHGMNTNVVVQGQVHIVGPNLERTWCGELCIDAPVVERLPVCVLCILRRDSFRTGCHHWPSYPQEGTYFSCQWCGRVVCESCRTTKAFVRYVPIVEQRERCGVLLPEVMRVEKRAAYRHLCPSCAALWDEGKHLLAEGRE